MDPGALSQVLSSRVRLVIIDAVSVRPRTLSELASISGISVQGVLRHLKLLNKLGLVEERKLSVKAPKARRVYAARGAYLGDYSLPGLTIVKATEGSQTAGTGRARIQDLEGMSGELLILRRRIRESARKLGRDIEELVWSQQSLDSTLDGMGLDDTQRLILGVLLTEETYDEGLKALHRYYGIEDRRSIDEALARAKRSVSK